MSALEQCAQKKADEAVQLSARVDGQAVGRLQRQHLAENRERERQEAQNQACEHKVCSVKELNKTKLSTVAGKIER